MKFLSSLRRTLPTSALLLAAACSPAKLPAPSADDPAALPASATEEAAEVSCSEGCEHEHPHELSAGALPETGLRRIDDRSQLCMVRDHFMGRPQLPVTVAGNTYYGCCPGCVNRLAKDPVARAAIDPVSHRSIDKALAVVAVNPRGGLVYFENEANFRAYTAGTVD